MVEFYFLINFEYRPILTNLSDSFFSSSKCTQATKWQNLPILCVVLSLATLNVNLAKNIILIIILGGHNVDIMKATKFNRP